MTDRPQTLPAPGLTNVLLESRVFGETFATVLVSALLTRSRASDGHTVLVLPGFAATDIATWPLRRALNALGYRALGWGLGRNVGLPAECRDRLLDRIRRHRRETGMPVSLLGWSLGGVFARELARHVPSDVRLVVTMGTPVSGDPRANNMQAIYDRLSGRRPGEVDWNAYERRRLPPPVPVTSIFSKTDGILAWQCSLEDCSPRTENVAIVSSHLGLPNNPLTLLVVADRLGQREGIWTPYDPPSALRFLIRPYTTARHATGSGESA
ncbi:MAG: alpha/beta fold hydrolase [Candidatus Schekmanbacteria bacterium]|nr:alpha/beta fold hydrolase [Candidatus Schekmanbacteria bacterium]